MRFIGSEAEPTRLITVPITDCKDGAGLLGLLLAWRRFSYPSEQCDGVTNLLMLDLAPHRFYSFHHSVNVHLDILTER